MKEEGSAVAGAVGDTALGQEGVHEEAAGIMTQTSELERQVREKTMGDAPARVECLCVHGKCKAGESECSGRCLTGWSGPHCDIPDER